MFASATHAAPSPLTAAREALARVTPAQSSNDMADQIRGLEELRGVLAAAQATVTAAFTKARRAEQLAAGIPARRVGLGIAQEIGLAKRESPSRAARFAGFSNVLTSELPCTFAALQAGRTSEWRALLVARETGWLSAAHRAVVDAQLAPRLHTLGDRAVEAEARRLAYALDPHGLVARIARAAAGRRVGLRPEPEGMTRLSALLPLTQGVATLAALTAAADAARAQGDPRGRGHVMADTLVERVTGQAHADDVPLRVNVLISADALMRTGPDAEQPALISGHGPIPAPHARDLIADTASADSALAPPVGVAQQARVLLRRVFTDPAGRLVSMETRQRCFTPAMAELVRLRDQNCTTPYCGAPIRHIDHIVAAADGGPTSLANATGLCESCNQAKEAPGWSVTMRPDGTPRVITPTGHDTVSFTTARAPTQPATHVYRAFAAPPGRRGRVLPKREPLRGPPAARAAARNRLRRRPRSTRVYLSDEWPSHAAAPGLP